MSYTPPTQPFQDNVQPVGGGGGQPLDAAFFTALVAGVDGADTRLAALEARGRGLPVYNVQDYGAAGDDVTDDYAAFRAAIDAMPNGANLFIPPVAKSYRLSQTLVIDKCITVQGTWSRQKGTGDPPFGSVLRPTTPTAQQNMIALVQIARPWILIENVFLLGLGAANGSAGVIFSGALGLGSHGALARRVGAVQFGTGFTFGLDSDHITLDSCSANGNTDGVTLQSGNRFDNYITNSLLDGNVRASVLLPEGAGTDNLTIIRTHLGFSQYGILQINTTNNNGISGLTLLDSPIEWVSVQHIKLVSSGNIRVQGGYWVWNGTPTKPAFEIDQVTYGSIWLTPRLEPNYPNANSPCLIQVNNFTNHPVYVDTPLNGFAQKVFGGHANETPRVKTFTASGTYTVPAGVALIDVTCVGGGGGGNGGGSALTSSGVTGQVGGAGGAAGSISRRILTVQPGDTYTVTVGAQGANGTGAALNGQPGAIGGNGGDTTFAGVAGTVTARGGGVGAQSLGNSTAIVNGAAWGGRGNSPAVRLTVAPGSVTAGCGGVATATNGGIGGDGVSVGAGGGAGGPASAANGGTGGTQGGANTGGPGGLSGGSTGLNGGGGGTATAAGAGGGGGGGGAPGGTGGNGGFGGPGICYIVALG